MAGRVLKPFSELPREGRCPKCKAILWQGAPPTASEFPLVCERECDAIVTPRMLGFKKEAA